MKKIIVALTVALSFTLAAQNAAAPAQEKAPAAVKQAVANTCKTPKEAVEALYNCTKNGDFAGMEIYSAGKAKKISAGLEDLMKAVNTGDIKECMMAAMRIQGIPQEQLAIMGTMLDEKLKTMKPEEKDAMLAQMKKGLSDMIETFKKVKMELGETSIKGKFATVKIMTTDPSGEVKHDTAYLAENNGIWYNIDKSDYDKATAPAPAVVTTPVAAPATADKNKESAK